MGTKTIVNEPFNIQQQIDFIIDLRKSFDNTNHCQDIINKYGTDRFAKMLRDINDSLLGLKLLHRKSN